MIRSRRKGKLVDGRSWIGWKIAEGPLHSTLISRIHIPFQKPLDKNIFEFRRRLVTHVVDIYSNIKEILIKSMFYIYIYILENLCVDEFIMTFIYYILIYACVFEI